MDTIDHLLTRGVDTIYPSKDALEHVLRSGKKLKLYQGFDPTGDKLHIGHAVAIRKLKQFQDLGHEVIFLIGDGTGQAGDPSGKLTDRGTFHTKDELRENAKDYVLQAGKIIRFEGKNPVKILYNSDWLNKLTLIDILHIAQHFSVQQLIERDMYQVRMQKGESINLREFLYPLLQGYDSVAMDVDLELGGTDQTFNMLAGRSLQKAYNNKEKFVMTVPLLTDSKGIKIGKTEGNVIGLTDSPEDFYGKIMALGDDAIIPCFTLLTDIPMQEISAIQKNMTNGENPMTYKKQLAFALTNAYNGKHAAMRAQKHFEALFQEKDIQSTQIPTYHIQESECDIVSLLVTAKLVTSKSEARRLLKQGAIKINNTPIDKQNIHMNNADILQVGKRKFLKIITH